MTESASTVSLNYHLSERGRCRLCYFEKCFINAIVFVLKIVQCTMDVTVDDEKPRSILEEHKVSQVRHISLNSYYVLVCTYFLA